MPDNAPVNSLVSWVNQVLDQLIQGLAADAVIAAQVAQYSFLGWPIIYGFFSFAVHQLATLLDTNIKINVDNIIIRFQNNSNLSDYLSAINTFNQESGNATTPSEMVAARAKLDQAISAAINRAKP